MISKKFYWRQIDLYNLIYFIIILNIIATAVVVVVAISEKSKAKLVDDLNQQCHANGNSESCKKELKLLAKHNGDDPDKLNRLCHDCRLTSRSIDDLIRRPRQVDQYGIIEDRVDFDKIKKLVCREYMNDDERERCRDFYFSNLPTIIDWKQSKSKASFHDFVCIQKLKYCCPQNSFGPRCKKCPECNPNEQCLGHGTRTGNGTCVCLDGHTGPDCVSCLPGYYSPGVKTKIVIINQTEDGINHRYQNETICKQCHKSCLYCRDDGPDGCEVCKSGFTFIPNYGCSDIDECVKNKGICGLNTFCVNTEGSYFCYDCDRACDGCHSDGPDGCIRCAKDYVLEKGICKATQASILKPEAHYGRYVIYIGLGISSLILYNNNIYLSALIGLVGAIYAGGSEYFLATHLNNY